MNVFGYRIAWDDGSTSINGTPTASGGNLATYGWTLNPSLGNNCVYDDSSGLGGTRGIRCGSNQGEYFIYNSTGAQQTTLVFYLKVNSSTAGGYNGISITNQTYPIGGGTGSFFGTFNSISTTKYGLSLTNAGSCSGTTCNASTLSFVNGFTKYLLVSNSTALYVYQDNLTNMIGQLQTGFSGGHGNQLRKAISIGGQTIITYLDNITICSEVEDCTINKSSTPTSSNFSLTLINTFNSSSVNTFNITLNGTLYTTTTGTITTNKLQNDTSLYNISFYSSNLFNKSYTNVNISNNFQGNLSQYPIVYLTNKWNNSNISSFNLLINSISYSSINQYVFIPLNSSYDITINATNYINITTTKSILENTLNQINISQSIINVSLKEFDSNISLSNFTINITGYNSLINVSGYNTTIYPNSGIYNLSNIIDNTRNEVYQLVYNNFSVDSLYIGNLHLYVYEHYINVTVRDIVSNGFISNFSIQLVDLTDGSDTRSFNTTNGYVFIPVVHHDYNISVFAEGYAYFNNSQTFSINQSVNTTFNLYITNSFDIYFFNESNGVNLSGNNILTLLNNGIIQISNLTNNSHAYFTNLSVGTYTITISSSGFETRYYQLEVEDRSYNVLNAYLLISTVNSVLFTAKDSDSGEVLSGVTVTISRWVNNILTNVEVIVTDITGSFTQNYDIDTRYDYSFVKSGYDTKNFSLNSVTSTAKNVLMDKSLSYTSDVDYANVLISYTPKSFKNGMTYNISFLFFDNTDTLEYYGFNASFNGDVISASGINPSGEVLQDSLFVNTSNIYDYVLITYWYKKTTGERHEFIDKYTVYNAGSLTWAENRHNTWGLGLFERTMLATLIVVVLAGAGAMFVGGVGAGIMSLVGFGIIIKIGLLSGVLAWASILTLIIVVAWRISQ